MLVCNDELKLESCTLCEQLDGHNIFHELLTPVGFAPLELEHS